MIPAFVVIALGVDPSRTLVLSQVVLSFGIPFALIPLVVFTSKRDVMGALVNTRLTIVTAAAIAVLISGLNLFLLVQIFGALRKTKAAPQGGPRASSGDERAQTQRRRPLTALLFAKCKRPMCESGYGCPETRCYR